MTFVEYVLNLDFFIDRVITKVCDEFFSEPFLEITMKSETYNELVKNNYDVKRIDCYLNGDDLYLRVVFSFNQETNQILKKVNYSEDGNLQICKLL